MPVKAEKVENELVCPSCGEWFSRKAKCPDCSSELIAFCAHCGELKMDCICNKEAEDMYYVF